MPDLVPCAARRSSAIIDGRKLMSKRQKQPNLQAAIDHFLDRYVSRFSEFNGYWLFGFLVRDNLNLEIDLLDEGNTGGRSPAGVARSIAVHEFQQLIARTPPHHVSQARLTIKTSDQSVEQLAGGALRRGHEMTFEVDVTTDEGTTHHATCARFVAPHDPALEKMSVDVEERDS